MIKTIWMTVVFIGMTAALGCGGNQNSVVGLERDYSEPFKVEWIYSNPAGLEFTKTEITLGQYKECVRAGGCKEDTKETKSDSKYCNWGWTDRDNHPMNCVNWYGADQFCRWLGGGSRLPTENEWYVEASNGSEKREWPWGNSPAVSCDYAIWHDGSNTYGCGKGSTWPVCSKPRGNSVSGLCDMSGNVWEWTSTDYNSSMKVLRGGSWSLDDAGYLCASYRGRVNPADRYYFNGFRCVRSRVEKGNSEIDDVEPLTKDGVIKPPSDEIVDKSDELKAERKTVDTSEELKKEGWFTSGCAVSPTGKGGPMCAIPSGNFWRGCNETVDKDCYDDEKPYKQIYLNAYYLDRHEVTVDEYRECVNAGKCKTDGLTMPYWSDNEQPDWAWACNWNKSGQGNHPINCIPWQYAEDYCKWAGKRLPTEAEWEKGARGMDGRKYPWGNDGYADTTMVANISDETAKKKNPGWPIAKGYDDKYYATSPVETYPRGKSPYGLYDMIGNVLEWTSDWYDENYYSTGPTRNPHSTNVKILHVLRGGSWRYVPSNARASYRFRSDSVSRYELYGFRCAVSAPSDF